MPRGSAPGERRGGRRKGVVDRRITERIKLAANMLEAVKRTADGRKETLDIQRGAVFAAQAYQQAVAEDVNRKLAKDVLEDFMHIFAGAAAYYQPRTPAMEALHGVNRNQNKAEFDNYAKLAVEA